jgi:hypothetical protein
MMRSLICIFFVFAISKDVTSGAEQIVVRTAGELHSALFTPLRSVEVRLLPGEYDLTPISTVDSTCGNCENPNVHVPVTAGLIVSGSKVRIVGSGDRSAIVRTNAGYGLFFLHCESCSIENLTITGGERDTSGLATDAAVVVKNSSVTIRNNRIVDNIGDSATVARVVVGIMGIAGRENSSITVVGNEIIRNSWDGIALYRGAEAVIEKNLIDGVDKATGQKLGGGRGVGIGVTWNGKAAIRGNLVKRYWKGIGLFVDAQGIVEDNIVEDIVTWGIALWDADKGKPSGKIQNNVVYKTGACGVSITRSSEESEPGHFRKNILVQTAQNPKYDSPDYYCYQCALAVHAAPKGFVIQQNYFYNNRRATTDLPDYDMPRDEFLAAAEQVCSEWLSDTILRHSDFVTDFCTK